MEPLNKTGQPIAWPRPLSVNLEAFLVDPYQNDWYRRLGWLCAAGQHDVVETQFRLMEQERLVYREEREGEGKAEAEGQQQAAAFP
jgi:hypothetical protein